MKTLKKSSARPADPKIIELPNAKNEVVPMTTGEAAEEQANLKLQAFPDGHIFKWTHHPTEQGKFVLFNTANEPIAVTQSAPIADLLCQAVRMLFHAVEESKQSARDDAPPRQNVEVRPDNEATRSEDAQTDKELAAELAGDSPVMES